MVTDHIAYRVEKYEAMGFSYAEAVTLSHTLDSKGVALYWDEVKKLLNDTGGNHAVTLDILIDLPGETVEYEESVGGIDDGA